MSTKITKTAIDTHINSLETGFDDIPDLISSNVSLSLEQLLEKSRVSPLEEIEEPPVCLEIVSNSEKSVFGTLGNFSAVTGKAKSKKTFLITMALATAIKKDLILEKFKGTLPEGQEKVLLFDTEQSKYHVQKVVKRVCQLIDNREPTNFECFGLRPYPTGKRIELIEYALNNIKGVGLVVIDGIRDLVRDINSPEEATKIVGLLMQWSEEMNIHIITVLHQNKGDNNARGHLGTEIVNKAESVISVTKETQDPATSIVEAEYCRDKDFNPFAFRINEKGLPYVLEDWVPAKEGRKSKSPFDYTKEVHSKIVRDVFKTAPRLSYSELINGLKYTLDKNSMPCGDNKAKDWFTYLVNQDFIKKDKLEGEKRCKYSLINSVV